MNYIEKKSIDILWQKNHIIVIYCRRSKGPVDLSEGSIGWSNVGYPGEGLMVARKLVDILSFHYASKVANSKKSVFQTCNILQVSNMDNNISM